MTLNAVMSALHDRPFRTEKYEEELIEFKNDRSSHAQCVLRLVKGSKGRHGYSLAEETHFSALVFLNCG